MSEAQKPGHAAEAEGARMSFDGAMAYGDYLRLDKVLDAQSPLSPLMTRCFSSSSIRPANYG